MAEILMCRPDHFTVEYRINPWMDPDKPVSLFRARAQWQALHDMYVVLGHDVELVAPGKGLPDMVYAANGGFTLDGVAYCPKFAVDERRGEESLFADWFEQAGFQVHRPRFVNEGEGDLIAVGDVVLAGHGFRTDPASHEELSGIFDREVVSLKLVDPRFYHLDTCLTPLGDNVAYFPDAFDEDSRAELKKRYPNAIRVGEDVASQLGLNCYVEGDVAVVPSGAGALTEELRSLGVRVIPMDMSEILLGGGSVKCCTLRLRR